MDDGSGEFGRSAGSARRGTAQRLARRGDRVNGAIGPHPSPSGRIARTWSDTAKRLSLLAAATTVCASGAFAQTASEVLGPAAASGTTAARVVPLAEAQPPARIVVDPPLAEALARGVVVLQYRAENLRILPVFGPGRSRFRRASGTSTSPLTICPGTGRTQAAFRSSSRTCLPARTGCWSSSPTPTITSLTSASSSSRFQTSASGRGRRRPPHPDSPMERPPRSSESKSPPNTATGG